MVFDFLGNFLGFEAVELLRVDINDVPYILQLPVAHALVGFQQDAFRVNERFLDVDIVLVFDQGFDL